MSDLNCICFRCKQSLIETDSYGQLLWGCVNCKLWWLARGPGRAHVSQEQLRALNQAPNRIASATTAEIGEFQGFVRIERGLRPVATAGMTPSGGSAGCWYDKGNLIITPGTANLVAC